MAKLFLERAIDQPGVSEKDGDHARKLLKLARQRNNDRDKPCALTEEAISVLLKSAGDPPPEKP